MKKTTANSAATGLALLGGMTAKRFLREYWQKKPLLVRQAIPGFQGLLSADELAGLACEDDVQARLVIQQRGQWRLEHGPFDEERFARLPKKNWTLLVQEVDHHLQPAADLLQRFAFIPHARLDDLMVSYAPDGGGVGPHFDSYDVFLLQGEGRRSWRISRQEDLALIDGAPLRILKHFDTEQDYVLEAGDMLYLPPQVAHWGIAVGDCMTYSVGFRAPQRQELASEFLGFLQDRCNFSGLYQDPGLALQRHPAKIGDDMLEQVAAWLRDIRWQTADVAQFLGRYLSEPKPHVVFTRPRPIGEQVFRKRLQAGEVALALKSRMLFRGAYFFMNGEQLKVPAAYRASLQRLADQRCLAGQDITQDFMVRTLYAWYQAGYVVLRGKRG